MSLDLVQESLISRAAISDAHRGICRAILRFPTGCGASRLQAGPGSAGIFAGHHRLAGVCVLGGSLVRFQGTQDRISLILGVGFMVCGAVLTATSVLFFQFLHDVPVQFLWAPVAWWVSRMVFALLLLVALLVERFLPHSRHPRRGDSGRAGTVMCATYMITMALRRLAGGSFSAPRLVGFRVRNNLCRAQFFCERDLVSPALESQRHRVRQSHLRHRLAESGRAMAASQSEHLLDAPFALAQSLTVMQLYRGAWRRLLDNARFLSEFATSRSAIR